MPNSLLWIGLVLLWLFVLFPMLTDRHPKARRTSDVALATRILSKSSLRRHFMRGPASGHDSDPRWDGEESHDDEFGRSTVTRVKNSSRTRAAVVEAEVVDEPSSDNAITDGTAENAVAVEVVEAVETAQTAQSPEAESQEDVADQSPQADGAETPATDGLADDGLADAADAEDSNSSEVAVVDDSPAAEESSAPRRPGRGAFDPESDAVARASRYAFRQRVLLALTTLTLLSVAVAFFAFAPAWWGAGAFGAALVLYLAFLRRQVQIEEEVRRRRMARLQRTRIQIADDRNLRPRPDVRQRIPRALVLEADDGDPAFDYLPSAEEVVQANARRRPHYAGQVRRAVGQ